MGLEAEIRYLAGARDAVLTATSTRMGGSKHFAHNEVLVTDGGGHRVALFTATAYRLPQTTR